MIYQKIKNSKRLNSLLVFYKVANHLIQNAKLFFLI